MNFDNLPRKLTDKEISHILNIIPLNHMSDIQIYNEIISKIEISLSYIEITPNGIDDLRNEILIKFNQSLELYLPMKINRIKTICKPISSQMLNEFHSYGRDLTKRSVGLDRIKELLKSCK